jgi:hypothetical protein
MLFGNFASIDFQILKLHRDLGPALTDYFFGVFFVYQSFSEYCSIKTDKFG